MILLLLLLVVAVCFTFGEAYIVTSSLFNSKRLLRNRWQHKTFALKPGVESILAAYKSEYENLLKSNSNDSERLSELRIIFECVNALKVIENDLAMFAEHENGTDEALKKTAKIFSQEFLVCKKQIEEQLNSLLPNI